MPDNPVCVETVQFPNHREARLVKAATSDKIDDLLTALTLPPAKTLVLIIGGADGLAEQLKPHLEEIIHRAVIKGTGRLADALTASEAHPIAEPSDSEIAEIRIKGRISTVSIDDDLREIARVMQGRPPELGSDRPAVEGNPWLLRRRLRGNVVFGSAAYAPMSSKPVSGQCPGSRPSDDTLRTSRTNAPGAH